MIFVSPTNWKIWTAGVDPVGVGGPKRLLPLSIRALECLLGFNHFVTWPPNPHPRPLRAFIGLFDLQISLLGFSEPIFKSLPLFRISHPPILFTWDDHVIYTLYNCLFYGFIFILQPMFIYRLLMLYFQSGNWVLITWREQDDLLTYFLYDLMWVFFTLLTFFLIFPPDWFICINIGNMWILLYC